MWMGVNIIGGLKMSRSIYIVVEYGISMKTNNLRLNKVRKVMSMSKEEVLRE